MMDAYNGIWSGGYNAAEMVYELRDVLCDFVHFKDGPDNALIREGNGDIITTAKALKDIGFGGYVISENDYKTDVEVRVAADLATLKHLFEN